MLPVLKPSKLFVLVSLILPFSFCFVTNVETKTIQYPSKSFNKEQIGLLKAGKVKKEIFFARPKDNYYKIGRKFGLSAKYLMSINNVKSPYLYVKDPVIIKQFIEPESSQTGLIINLPEQKLYHFSDGKLLKTYGVAVGLPTWQTPMGNFSILYKTKAPDWHVPVSIQKEMAEKGETVKKIVPAGPGNPLGNWWMAIASGIGIHSTNAPSSIGYSVTHGCIRMKPKSAEDLFKKVKVKTPVKIIYQPVKIGVDDNSNVYLEAYRDVYSRNINYPNTTNMLLKESNLAGNINWDTVSKVLRARLGIPVLISKVVSTRPIVPSVTPTSVPTLGPSVAPTSVPTLIPTATPESLQPTVKPTNKPDDINPYISPTEKPIDIIPSVKPTSVPRLIPTTTPSSVQPTVKPTNKPSDINPYVSPTEKPIDIIPSVRPRPTVTPFYNPAPFHERITPTVKPSAGKDDFLDTTHPR